MNTEFLPEADAEFREAVRYYEEEAPGVGMAFIAEVHRAISLIVDNPGGLGKNLFEEGRASRLDSAGLLSHHQPRQEGSLPSAKPHRRQFLGTVR